MWNDLALEKKLRSDAGSLDGAAPPVQTLALRTAVVFRRGTEVGAALHGHALPPPPRSGDAGCIPRHA